jgi:hypothetical protein
LVRLLLLVQFLLLAAVLIFSVVTKPSTSEHGLMAGIAVMIMIAVSAWPVSTLFFAQRFRAQFRQR